MADWSGDESCRPKRKRLMFTSTPSKEVIVIDEDEGIIHEGKPRLVLFNF